jgi:hypothetical protein
MRKLFPFLCILLLADGGCKKNTPAWYAASFLGSINGSPTLPVDFTGPIDQMTCDQSYFTGGPTKIARWTFSFHSTLNNNAFTLTIPSTDSSNTMPTGKPLTFSYSSNSPASQNFELSVLYGGSVFSASDSGIFVITFNLFDKQATADFTGSLYGPNGTYIITEGSFTGVPITYAN